MPGHLAVALLLPCLVSARVNFRGSGQFGQSQVDALLSEELADAHHRLNQYESEMRQMFGALPKNEFGNLGHDALRSALHRFFVKRHGWYLHGLEPGSFVDVEVLGNRSLTDKDRLPVLLQDTFERTTLGRGAALHDAAAIAAAVEDLIHGEVDAHVNDAYAAVEVPREANLTFDDAYRVSKVYFMSFLLEHNWTVESQEDLAGKEQIFADNYPLYSQAITWLNRTVEAEVGANPDIVDAKTVTRIANKVGEEYHTLNDNECADLRAQLATMESRVAGRIRLSVFYNMSLHSHWKFNEKVETLRALGALDESKADQPSVIIANYAVAKPNCVNASNVYDICCRNTCEDLMTHLEQDIGASTATAERIEALVANLPSESVQAPRELPAALRGRLEEVAEHHNGLVPLHGRLFAQWLHHAYPLECPYPQEAGVTNLELWTGDERDEATDADMKEHIDADTCSVNWEGKIDCGEESTELPWSTKEELFESGYGRVGEPRGQWSAFRMVLVVIGLALAVLSSMPEASLGAGVSVRLESAVRSAGLQRWHLSVSILTATAFVAGMLDPIVLGIAVVGGLVAKFASPKTSCKGDFNLPMQQKCV